MESLDLVTSNAEEARTWITGLRYLMAGISDEDSLAKRQRTHDQYPFKCLTFEVPSVDGSSISFYSVNPVNTDASLTPLDVVEADVRGGRQERRRTPKHR